MLKRRPVADDRGERPLSAQLGQSWCEPQSLLCRSKPSFIPKRYRRPMHGTGNQHGLSVAQLLVPTLMGFAVPASCTGVAAMAVSSAAVGSMVSLGQAGARPAGCPSSCPAHRSAPLSRPLPSCPASRLRRGRGPTAPQRLPSGRAERGPPRGGSSPKGCTPVATAAPAPSQSQCDPASTEPIALADRCLVDNHPA